MYYGYLDRREVQGTVVIFTKPCDSVEQANIEFCRNFKRLHKTLQVEYYGKDNGVLSVNEVINIPTDYYGTKVRF